jgi:acyl CoA:acetate/3-ketoacid CoA transferase
MEESMDQAVTIGLDIAKSVFQVHGAALEDLVEVVTIGGQELLWYKSFPINVAIIRGSFGDPDGNVGRPLAFGLIVKFDLEATF